MSTGHTPEFPPDPPTSPYASRPTGAPQGFPPPHGYPGQGQQPPGYPASSQQPSGYPGQGQPPQWYPGQGMAQYPQGGPIGQVRPTGVSMLLFIVTLGIYGWIWYFKTHEELKQHSGGGLGGGIALLLAIFVGIVMPFLTASEIGDMYARRGQEKPVSGITGLWILLPIAGAIVWFVKTNGAINNYWRSLGAR